MKSVFSVISWSGDEKTPVIAIHQIQFVAVLYMNDWFDEFKTPNSLLLNSTVERYTSSWISSTNEPNVSIPTDYSPTDSLYERDLHRAYEGSTTFDQLATPDL